MSGWKMLMKITRWYRHVLAHLHVNVFLISSQNESEIIPFPNKEVEFELSGEDFKDIITKEYPRISNDSAQEDKSEVKSDTGIIPILLFKCNFL